MSHDASCVVHDAPRDESSSQQHHDHGNEAADSMARALITGATGFVGSFLAEHLLACGDEPLGVSASGRWPDELLGDRTFGATARRVPLVAWDVAESPSAETLRAFEEFAPTVIYHLAALSVPKECGDVEPTERALAVNVGGTRAVVELAARLPSRPRLLFVSTGHVYGGSGAVDESAPLEPRGPYGRTKVLAEAELLREIAAGRADGVIARAFKHAGPRQGPQMMLSEWCSQFARPSREPVLVQTFDSYLDLCDVRDVVRAYRLLVERAPSGGIFNVGGGRSVRCGDLFLALRDMADPERPYRETKPGLKREPIADIGKLAALTGWRPEIPVATTLRDTLDWWRQRWTADARTPPPTARPLASK